MKIAGIIAAVLVVLGAVTWWYFYHPTGLALQALNSATTTSDVVVALTQTYMDPDLKFSFNYPEGYHVREMAGEGAARTLLAENTATSDGIQVLITPDSDDTDITPEVIRAAIPDMMIESPQPFNVAGHTGLAFKSDNAAFDGALAP